MLERKGVQYVLKALEESRFCHEVHIVGDGPCLPALRQMDQATGNNVTFWGWLDNPSPEFKELFETSGILLKQRTSRSSCWKPWRREWQSFTTESTGCAEVVGDAAILVKSRDVEAS